jgi:hypothetical protein
MAKVGRRRQTFLYLSTTNKRKRKRVHRKMVSIRAPRNEKNQLCAKNSNGKKGSERSEIMSGTCPQMVGRRDTNCSTLSNWRSG